MKTTMKFLVIFLTGLTVLSCSKKKESELEVELSGANKSFLIDNKFQTCSNAVDVYLNPDDTDVSYGIAPLSFSIRGAKLIWKNKTDTAYISYIKVEVKSDNISGSCTYAESELQSIFFKYGLTPKVDGIWIGNALTPMVTDPALNPDQIPTFRESGCPIRCGGISVKNKDIPSFGNGTMTIVGFAVTPGGDEYPIRVTKSIGVTYE